MVNDYLVKPHYHGLSSHTLMGWAKDIGLDFYSTWPNTDLPFVVDSPYFEPLDKTSEIYKFFISLNRLRWLFEQKEDSVVFSELVADMESLGEKIETFLDSLSEILQKEVYTDTHLSNFRGQLNAVVEGVERAGLSVLSYLHQNLEALGGELDRILTLIVNKAMKGSNFDLEQLNGLLFKGYNGLGTSYTIWHKPQ